MDGVPRSGLGFLRNQAGVEAETVRTLRSDPGKEMIRAKAKAAALQGRGGNRLASSVSGMERHGAD